MKRFKNILLICDEGTLHSELIVRAISLAKANDARIALVDVIAAAPGELARVFGALPGKRANEVEHEVVEFHRSRLAKIAAPIGAEGIETSEMVLQGSPFMEIIRKVLRDGHDLVMKGAAGAKEGNSLFFGSTDLHLVRKCPCPVWIMKKDRRQRIDRVLAAVDPDPANEQRHALNTIILDLATSLSALNGCDLDVVHTWKLDEEDTLRITGFSRVSNTEVDLLAASEYMRSERKLKELMEGYPDEYPKRNVHLLKGAAQEIIPKLAEEKRVDLIVMGTVGRTGIRGLIIGNTAEAILNQVECSVLAVKPPGFETPVRVDMARGSAEAA